jgi:hypothetical protein
MGAAWLVGGYPRRPCLVSIRDAAPLEGLAPAPVERPPVTRPASAVARPTRLAGVADLLARIAEQERLADEAQSDLDEYFGWPSWSMDTGLTPAQEKFVEHWSPQRVLDDLGSVRRLVGALERWSSAHEDDESLDEALTILTNLHPR